MGSADSASIVKTILSLWCGRRSYSLQPSASIAAALTLISRSGVSSKLTTASAFVISDPNRVAPALVFRSWEDLHGNQTVPDLPPSPAKHRVAWLCARGAARCAAPRRGGAIGEARQLPDDHLDLEDVVLADGLDAGHIVLARLGLQHVGAGLGDENAQDRGAMCGIIPPA